MPEIVAINVDPNPVVRGEFDSVTFVVEIAAPESADVQGELVSPDGETRLKLHLRQEGPLWRALAELPKDSSPGLWTVEARDGEDLLELEFPVEIAGFKNLSRIEFTIDPQTAEYGERLIVRGILGGLPEDELVGQEVVLVFREAESFLWEEVVRLRTDRRGEFLVGVPAEASGSWLIKYAGVTYDEEAREAGRADTTSLRTAAFETSVMNATGPRVVVAKFNTESFAGRAGKVYYLKGSVRETSPGDTAASSGARLHFSFRATKTQDAREIDPTWTPLAKSNGSFKFEMHIGSSGYWYVRTMPASGGTKSGWWSNPDGPLKAKHITKEPN
ncbi:hypothetical protein ACIBG8_36580 [Nonomuraea sp. NPDC050556]|uniref:hypothetical protein n=1 Tax=Nonomuraea sp. NPDC050556 TaxID=3364369 RepID=UPI00379FC550